MDICLQSFKQDYILQRSKSVFSTMLSKCMNFESAMSYLESLVSYEKFLNVSYNEQDFDLEKFRNFLSRNGVNYQSLKFVHVGGSKGKGTTCGFIANYLVKSGYKVGLYTSPHILSVTERFWLNGASIGVWLC